MDLKVKGLNGKRRLVIETDRIGDWANAEVSYFISNTLSCGIKLLSPTSIEEIGLKFSIEK